MLKSKTLLGKKTKSSPILQDLGESILLNIVYIYMYGLFLPSSKSNVESHSFFQQTFTPHHTSKCETLTFSWSPCAKNSSRHLSAKNSQMASVRTRRKHSDLLRKQQLLETCNLDSGSVRGCFITMFLLK